MQSHNTKTKATTAAAAATVIATSKLNDWPEAKPTIRLTISNRLRQPHAVVQASVKKIYGMLTRPSRASHSIATTTTTPTTTATAATAATMHQRTRLRRMRRRPAASCRTTHDKPTPSDEAEANNRPPHELTMAGGGAGAGAGVSLSHGTGDVNDINNNNNNNKNDNNSSSNLYRLLSRRKVSTINPTNTTTTGTTTAATAATAAAVTTTTTTTATTHRRRNRNTWWHVGCRNYHPVAYVALLPLLLLLFTTTSSLSAASPCEANHWWDPVRDKCILCTNCQGEMIPLRPCQLHRDTICGSIYDLKIDWVVLAKTEPNWKERRKDDAMLDYGVEHLQSHQLQHLTQEQLQQLHDEAIPLDWQTGALFFAVLACLLFFIVAAGILIHHMRQWRRMERRLDQDVEELSTKLMAKLAEVQSLEGGTFFIGNADALRLPTSTAFQPQHVLLPAEKPVKHHQRRILKTLHPGNVYIEENGSKG